MLLLAFKKIQDKTDISLLLHFFSIFCALVAKAVGSRKLGFPSCLPINAAGSRVTFCSSLCTEDYKKKVAVKERRKV